MSTAVINKLLASFITDVNAELTELREFRTKTIQAFKELGLDFHKVKPSSRTPRSVITISNEPTEISIDPDKIDWSDGIDWSDVQENDAVNAAALVGTADPDKGTADPDKGTADPDKGTADPDKGTADGVVTSTHVDHETSVVEHKYEPETEADEHAIAQFHSEGGPAEAPEA